MPANHDQLQSNEPSKYTWAVRLFVKGQPGYGAFSCVMNYVPSVGHTLEFYGTPEGDFTGEVIGVNHAAEFARMSPIEPPEYERFGIASLHDYCYVLRQEWQVSVNVTSASELQEFGVPEL